MSTSDAYTDVVELCAMLQCLGFSVKSLDTSDTNISQDGSTRTIVINCQSSGLHVVLESEEISCSCPSTTNQQNSGFWQVSGVAGGKQLNKEYGSALLGALPKAHRDRLTKQLQEMVRCIKENNESEIEKLKDKDADTTNKSASMTEIKSPERRNDMLLKIKSETPKRYRSLDTLTENRKSEETLPAPGPLQKLQDDTSVTANKKMGPRQSTYTLSMTPNNVRSSNKTSSPIQAPPNTSILESLVAAERMAEDLRNKLSSVIKEYTEDDKHDSSISSLALDVSKISVLKIGECSKPQFASSPDLSGIPSVQDNFSNRLKRGESSSISNLAPSRTTNDGKTSRLRKISPNIFNFKKGTTMTKLEKLKSEDIKSNRLNGNGLLKCKAVTTPGRTITKSLTESSPNLSASKKKYSHVKSTIPRPSSKKD